MMIQTKRTTLGALLALTTAITGCTNGVGSLDGAAPALIQADLDGACTALAAQLYPRLPEGWSVAVPPFVDAAGGVRRLGAIVADGLQEQLLARGTQIVDRENLNALLAEQDLQLMASESHKAVKQAGQLAGAQILVVGRTTRASERVLLSAKALDVKTGRVLAATGTISLHTKQSASLMWYVRRPPAVVPGGQLPPLSVRYEFVSQGPAGETALTDGGTVRSGQRFKVRIQPNSDCFLYVLLYDSQGHATVLFPHKKIRVSNKVRGGASYEVPGGSKWYWFDQNPGTETFYVVASYTPLEAVDGILARMERAGGQSTQLAQAARKEIDTAVTRGMVASGAADYQPKGLVIGQRGVGGIVDIGWGPEAPQTKEIDNIVTGCATVVKKLTMQHR